MPDKQLPTNAVQDSIKIPTFTISFWHVLLVLVIASVLGVLLVWWDHRQSKKKKGRRVPELWMMVLGLLGGATAMYAYMRSTKHKMRYLKFKIGLPLMAVVHWIFLVLTIVFDHPHKAIEIDVVYIIIGYALMNLVGVFVVRMDKRRAKRDMWRVSEDTLITIAALGGAVGMFLSMLLMHHKTRHLKFMLGLPLMVVAHIGIFAWMCSSNIFFIWFP